MVHIITTVPSRIKPVLVYHSSESVCQFQNCLQSCKVCSSYASGTPELLRIGRLKARLLLPYRPPGSRSPQRMGRWKGALNLTESPVGGAPCHSFFVICIHNCLLSLCLTCILFLFPFVSSHSFCIYFHISLLPSFIFMYFSFISNVVSLFRSFFSVVIFHVFLSSVSPFWCYRHLFSFPSVLMFIILLYSKFYSSVASCFPLVMICFISHYLFLSRFVHGLLSSEELMNSRILRRL